MNYPSKNPLTFVIFGATGDLAKKKILAALFDLNQKEMLGDRPRIVAYARKDLTNVDYRDFARGALLEKRPDLNAEQIDLFLKKIYYVRGDLENVDDYKSLNKDLHDYDNEAGVCSNKIYYLATPPHLYEAIFEGLDKADLLMTCKGGSEKEDSWTRILVEKPFGSDLKEALRLDKKLGTLFDESQIFRIDHYLAKEALQNIISFRFANAIFEPIWNSDYIDRVEIKLFETSDVNGRVAFYDKIGALRDVGQNHVLQMLALVAMEDPMGITSKKIREARSRVLGQIVPASRKPEKYAYRAQYDGYKDLDEAYKNSQTETYFKVKFNVKNKRWHGVPFILESGKALNEDRVEINIIFKDKKSSVCQIDEVCHFNNRITINIQPQEKISLGFWVKKPGLNFELEQKNLAFDFSDDNVNLSDAYEKVLYDCIRGDASLFTSTEEVLREWGIIEKVCEDWQELPLNTYEKGSDPASFNALTEKF